MAKPIESIESFTWYGRPFVRLSDYEKTKNLKGWEHRYRDGDEIFIVPDELWIRLPKFMKKQKELYG